MDLKTSDAGHYICTGRNSDGSATSYIHTLHVIDKPIITYPRASAQSEQESIHNSRMIAHDCVNLASQVSRVNLAKTKECLPAGDSNAYSVGIPMSTNIIFHENYSRGTAKRCKLFIAVYKSYCGRGFGGYLMYSSITGEILTSKSLFPLSKKQCDRAHQDENLTITLGKKRVTLNTDFLGSQETIAYLNGEAFANLTCIGASVDENMWLGPENPTVPSKGRDIIKTIFSLDIESESYEINLEAKTLTVPRLGLEIEFEDPNNITNTDNSGTLVIDSKDIPSDKSHQFHLVQTVEATLYEASDNGTELHCRAIMISAPEGLLGQTDPILTKAKPHSSTNPLYRYTTEDLHKLPGLYHLVDQDNTGHAANYIKKENNETFILKKPGPPTFTPGKLDRWYITEPGNDAQIFAMGSDQYPGVRPFLEGKVHLSYNRGNEPTGELGHGLEGECVLRATQPAEEDDENDSIPSILTANLKIKGESKSIAVSLLKKVNIGGINCFSTQTQSIFMCNKNTLKESIDDINTMDLGEQNKDVLTELSSNSINFIQLSVDQSIGQVVNKICQLQKQQMELALNNFERTAVTTFFQTKDRPGLRALSSREETDFYVCNVLVLRSAD
mgnify:CR=1 FL=1